MLELKIGSTDEGMGWMEFVSSIVGSLAWPVAAVIVAAIFHRQIAGLLAKVRKLNWEMPRSNWLSSWIRSKTKRG